MATANETEGCNVVSAADWIPNSVIHAIESNGDMDLINMINTISKEVDGMLTKEGRSENTELEKNVTQSDSLENQPDMLNSVETLAGNREVLLSQCPKIDKISR